MSVTLYGIFFIKRHCFCSTYLLTGKRRNGCDTCLPFWSRKPVTKLYNTERKLWSNESSINPSSFFVGVSSTMGEATMGEGTMGDATIGEDIMGEDIIGDCYKSKVNKQDFLQVFQGSGIRKKEDNLTSADPLIWSKSNLVPFSLEHDTSLYYTKNILIQQNVLEHYKDSPYLHHRVVGCHRLWAMRGQSGGGQLWLNNWGSLWRGQRSGGPLS